MNKWSISIVLIFGMLACAGADTGETAACASLKYVVTNNIAEQNGLMKIKRVYAQQGNAPLCFEAEEASWLRSEQLEKCIITDSKAVGGYYVAHVSAMGFEFLVQTPGRYQAWYRASFPYNAPWAHIEQMDDGERKLVVDGAAKRVKEWYWQPGPFYTLTAGSHVFRFPHPTAWCAGPMLDRVALVPEGAGPLDDKGPPASGITSPAEGVAETKDIKAREIISWSLDYELNANDGHAVIEYSCDQGKTWTPLPGPGVAVAVAEGTERVRIRFRLSAAAGRPSPWLYDVKLNYVLKP